jgi:hypothetical protein
MTIAICGSMKFNDQILEAKKKLDEIGHTVLIPIRAEGIDYWSEDGAARVEAKKKFEFISEHMDKIEQSDAILVVNITKKEIENYVGANTFLEIGFAHYRNKKIYFLNPIPDQKYLLEELQVMDPIILNGDLTKIK